MLDEESEADQLKNETIKAVHAKSIIGVNELQQLEFLCELLN